jgi:hypothetical protein
MAIDDLVTEHAVSALGAVARASVTALRFVFVHFLYNIVLFNLGRVALLLVSFGRYPRGRTLSAHEGRISACGVLVVILVWCGIALFNHFAHAGIGA